MFHQKTWENGCHFEKKVLYDMICVYESGWIGTISVGKKPEVEMGGGNESIPGSSWAHMYLQSTKNYIITGYILSTGHCAVNVLPHSVLTTILRIGASMLSFCRWENRSTERYHNWPIVTKFFHSRPRNWTWIAHDSLHSHPLCNKAYS